MSNLRQQIADLSPEKRALLERLAKKQGVDLQSAALAPSTSRPIAATPRGDSGTFSLSFAQQRLWFLDQLEPGSPLYNIPTGVRLSGALDMDALRRSLHAIIQRHETLRTSFTTRNDQPVQQISAEPAELPLHIVDLTTLPPAQREAEAHRLGMIEAQQPFDLTRGPLLRVTLLKLTEDDFIALLVMHHIVSDGWSMGVLVRELATLYAAFSQNQPSPLPDLPIQYVDFAQWQRQQLAGENLERQLAYWRQQLGGEAPVLHLPTDRPRPAMQSARGASFNFHLPKSLAAGINALAQQERATLFMALLAAFQTLLSRYAGQDDIAVGTPIANRNRGEIEGLIGFFVNTLVMRLWLGPDDQGALPSFRQVLARMREVAMGAYAHQDVPFEMLVEDLQPERDLSHTPLFQVMFALQNTPSQPVKLPDLTMAPVLLHSGTATFDLTLIMGEQPDGLTGAIEYNTDLFDVTTIERLAGHFAVLLQAIVDAPDTPIALLPIMTESERQQVVVGWNGEVAEVPQHLCVHHLFEVTAAATPDAAAVIFPGATAPLPMPRGELTYGELNRRANQVARALRSLGVGNDDLVGLSVERSLDLTVGLLGILKAGAAYLPIDPGLDRTLPAERTQFILADSGVSIILTQAHLAENYRALGLGPICLDSDWDRIAEQPDHNLEDGAAQDPRTTAYVIYTSGSTGQPKGVQVAHRGVVNHNIVAAQRFGLTPSDRVLQFATINFDAAVEEIFPTWHAGATLVLRPDAVLTTGDELRQLVEAEGVTVLDFPTAYWHEWVRELAQVGATVPKSLRLLIVGGDKALSGTFDTWLRLGGGDVTWLNTYGPTEGTIIASWYAAPAGLIAWDAGVDLPIGRPIPNAQIYVVDRYMQPAPIGVPGELCIGGVGVARGYLNRPNLTAEKFVPNPFAVNAHGVPVADNRLYRTGDLVRWRPDGNLEFVGRTDHQVKVRGIRIELGDVEAALARHPSIREAVVVAQEYRPGQKRLVAYVAPERIETEVLDGQDTARPAQAPTLAPGDIRSFLSRQLPDYMLPAITIILPQLPRTGTGKVDRRALPAPDQDRPELAAAYAAPRTPVEDVLAGIWAQVLGVELVGVQDNFFELGGHSLLATQLVSRVRNAFQLDLPVRALFEHPTVASLAEAVELARRSAEGLAAPPIVPVPRDGELPLSFGQQRMWFLDQLEPNSPLYNIPDAVRIRGRLDADVLQRCLDEIVRRHEALRTTFPTVDGKAQQVIAPALSIPLPVVDLSALPPEQRETALDIHTREEARQPFDLALGPLLRAKVLRLANDDHVVLLTMHHIISDGWSSTVLTREIAALYDAFSRGEVTSPLPEVTSPLPELPIQYADFAHWQRHWLQGEVLERQIAYWKETLADLPPLLELPTDRPRPAMQSSQGAHVTFALAPALSEQLRAFSRQQDATLFMTTLAGFQALLHRYTGQEVFGVGTPIANRNRREIEDLIGFFVNTLVLRADLSGAPSFRQLVQRARETALGAYSHQDLPFEILVDALHPQRDLGHTPLFQVMFTLQSGSQAQRRVELQLPDLSLSQMDVETGMAPFDLTLVLSEGQDGLAGAVEYNTDLFDEATIQRMVSHLERLLTSAIADPDRPVTQLDLLPAAEQRLIVSQWNDTAAAYPADLCMHQLFEATAAATPDALAAVQPTHAGQPAASLTYAELDQRANQLAHHLRSLGAGPGTLVGLSIRRSLNMLVGLLGILKAGAAYLPLDPAYPAERLAFMVQDSGTQLLVTERQTGIDAPDGVAAASSVTPSSESAAFSGSYVYLDGDWPLIARQPMHAPASSVTPDDLAYVIYTSGSTGKPKGVMVAHRSVVNHNVAAARLFKLAPRDRVLQFATINFDAAIEEIFPTWHAGGVVVLRPAEVLTAAGELLELIETYGLTVLDLPTAYWHEWVSTLELLGQSLPQSLRLVIVGGDKASAERLAAWQRVAPGVRWLNTYGPTEGTIIASSHEEIAQPDGGDPAEVGAATSRLLMREIPIGRPIANVQLHILDRHGQLAPIGVPGELHIGGLAVARGYLNRPDLTAERFVPDPFAAGDRVYNTGDLARWRPDGVIEFIGRADTQVKIRGFRVEPGEIEAALEQHAGVRECAVVAHSAPTTLTGHKRLVAYVAAAPGLVPDAAELRAFLKERLPDYMVPSAIVLLDALPRSPAGKVDRRQLSVRPLDAQDGQAAAEVEPSPGAPPRSQAEETLAAIWAQVLGVPQVGVHDNFFELGGDSILSIQVIARAGQAGLRLTPRQLFEHPTVAGLAAVAQQGQVIDAEQGLVTGPFPLTPIQHWFLEQNLAEPHHWNQALLLELSENVDPSHLEAAVEHLLRHHDALRMRLDHGSAQARLDGLDGPPAFQRFDLSAHHNGEAGPPRPYPTGMAAAIEAEAARLQGSLNLETGPIMRVGYFDLGHDRAGRLMIVVHHLAMDGVSWRILLEDLQSAYAQLQQGMPVRLPPKTTSFRQWAQRLREHANSTAVAAELPYWLDALAPALNGDTAASALPRDFPQGDNSEASERSVVVQLGETETKALLQEAPAAFRADINTLLLAGLAQALGQWLQSQADAGQHVLVELEGHGREEIAADLDVSRTIGWFTTAYPVLLDTNESTVAKVKELLRRVPQNGISFGLLRYLADSPAAGSLRTLPLPEVSFNYLGQFDQVLPQESPFRPARESRGPDRSLAGQRSYVLEINGGVAGGRLQLAISYSENLHDRTTIEWLARDYEDALRAIIDQARSTGDEMMLAPEDFPLAKLSQKDLAKVLGKLGQGPAAKRSGTTKGTTRP